MLVRKLFGTFGVVGHGWRPRQTFGIPKIARIANELDGQWDERIASLEGRRFRETVQAKLFQVLTRRRQLHFAMRWRGLALETQLSSIRVA